MQFMQKEYSQRVRDCSVFEEAMSGLVGRAQELENEWRQQALCLMEFTSLSHFCVGRDINKDVNRFDLYLL